MADILISDILIAVPAAIFIAAVSSWITVQLSLRKFRSEKWWERKADTYANVIEVLYNSQEFSVQHLEADEEGREISADRDAELRAKSKAAYAEIRRVANIGAFLLSDQAMLRLARLQKEEDDATNAVNWQEYLNQDWKAVSTCLDDLIEIAKADLKV